MHNTDLEISLKRTFRQAFQEEMQDKNRIFPVSFRCIPF